MFPQKIIFKSTGEVLERAETRIEQQVRLSYSQRGKTIKPKTVAVSKFETYTYTFAPASKCGTVSKKIGTTVDITAEYLERLIKYELIISE